MSYSRIVIFLFAISWRVSIAQESDVPSLVAAKLLINNSSLSLSGGHTVPVASGAGPSITPDLFTGTATVSLPIEVPPGRKGMTPALNLVYKTGQADSWVGFGWSLDFGLIEVDTKDGLKGDQFAFRTGSASVELVRNGSYFSAKYEGAFSRFEHTSEGNWIVTDRAGKRSIYGATPPDRIEDAAKPGSTTKWYLSRIEDTDGNYILFDYEKHAGVPYVQRIRYTGNAAALPLYEILFHLEQKPETEQVENYALGFKTQSTHRLRTIEIRARQNLYSAYDFVYTDTESQAKRSVLKNVVRFGKNAQVSADGAVSGGGAMPPTVFHYGGSPLNDDGTPRTIPTKESTLHSYEPGPNETVQWADVNGDGLLDHCRSFLPSARPKERQDESNGIVCQLSSLAGDFRTIRLAGLDSGYPWTRVWVDINGDGKADFCRTVGNPGAEFGRCTLSTGSGFDREVNVLLPGNEIQVGEAHVMPYWIDLNRDGHLDYCRLAPDIRRIPTPRAARDAADAEEALKEFMQEHIGYGRLRCTLSRNGVYDSPAIEVLNIDLGHRSGSGWVDVNGDRYPDFCRIVVKDERMQPPSNSIYKTGPEKTAISCIPFLGDQFGPETHTKQLTQIEFGNAMGKAWIDFNGDGLGDFCRPVQTATSGQYIPWELKCDLATDVGFSESISLGHQTLSHTDDGVRTWIDANGDGFLDFCSAVQSQPFCVFGNGRTLSDQRFFGQGTTGQKWDRSFADVNGDGFVDFCSLDRTLSRHSVVCMLTVDPPRDLLTRVSTGNKGEGGATDLVYIPSTRFSNAQLPVALPLLGSMTQHDGRGNAYTTSWSYKGGFWNLKAREFRGFSEVSEIGPKGSDGVASISTTWFHQGDGVSPVADDPNVTEATSRGKPYRQQISDSTGTVYSEEEIEYLDDSTTPFFKPVVSKTNRLHDKVDWRQETKTVFSYDEFGNVYRQVESGTTGGVVDFARTITRSYAKNTAKGFLGLPRAEAIFSAENPALEPIDSCASAASTNALSCTEWFYDDAKSCEDRSNGIVPEFGHVTRTVRWLKNGPPSETTAVFGDLGELICQTDARRKITRFEYDSSRSFLLQTTSPSGLQQQVSYYGINATSNDGLFGQIESEIDANGAKNKSTYDEFGRAVSTLAADGSQITTRYGDFGDAKRQFIETESTLGIKSRTYFDGLGRTYKAEQPGAAGKTSVVLTEFDARGLVARQSLPFFADSDTPFYISTTYDALGRSVRVERPNGAMELTCYDGATTWSVDGEGARSRSKADSRGLIVSVEVLKNKVWDCRNGDVVTHSEYKYDDLGRLIKVTGPAPGEIIVGYDELGRRTTLQDPNAGTWTYKFDAASNLEEQVRPDGGKVTFTYDEEGRVKTRTAGNGPAPLTTTYEYDQEPEPAPSNSELGRNLNGRVRKITHGTQYSETRSYDSVGRLDVVVRTIGTGSARKTYPTSYTYDLDGRLKSVTYPNKETMVREYDSALLKSITLRGKPIWTAQQWTALGQAKKVVLGQGLAVSLDYCARTGFGLCETEIRDSKDVLLYSRALADVDLSGQIKTIIDPILGDESFEYDERGQLTRFGSTTISYDASGNLRKRSDSQASVTYLAPPPTQRIASIGARTFQYNEQGGEKGRFTYDALGRPERVRIKVGDVERTTDNIFDDTGERVRQIARSNAAGVVSQVSVDYAGEEYRCINTQCQELVDLPGIGLAIFNVINGRLYFTVVDQVNSTRAVYTDTGRRIFLATGPMNPFGSAAAIPGSDALPRYFGGREVDQMSGLILMGARYYDPTLGRFTSADLGSPLAGEPLAYHRYAYAANNPVSLADPHGDNPLLVIAVGAILGGINAGVQSNWNFDAVMQGAIIGGITGSIGAIGGPWAAMAAGATGAAIRNGNILEGAALSFAGWHLSSALSTQLGDVAGGTATSVGLAAITGDDVGRAAAMSLSGRAIASTLDGGGDKPLQADLSGGSDGGKGSSSALQGHVIRSSGISSDIDLYSLEAAFKSDFQLNVGSSTGKIPLKANDITGSRTWNLSLPFLEYNFSTGSFSVGPSISGPYGLMSAGYNYSYNNYSAGMSASLRVLAFEVSVSHQVHTPTLLQRIEYSILRWMCQGSTVGCLSH